MSEHTPTPWYQAGEAIFQQGTGAPITEDLYPGNAAHIVRCVNERDELVTALESIADRLSDLEGDAYTPERSSAYCADMAEITRTALARTKA